MSVAGVEEENTAIRGTTGHQNENTFDHCSDCSQCPLAFVTDSSMTLLQTSQIISALPRLAECTIGICFETAKYTNAFECFFTGSQHSLWKFSTTGNLYSLKSWLWLAAVACVVHWPISNALLNDIWLTRFTRMYNWNCCAVVKLACRLAEMVKAFAKATNCKPLSRRYEFDSSQGQFVFLDIFINGLAVTCRSGWFHSASCLSRGRTYVLAFLHLNRPRHCCI